MPLVFQIIASIFSVSVIAACTRVVVGALGFVVIHNVGLPVIYDQIAGEIRGQMGSTSGDVAMLLGLTDIDLAVNFIISAYAVRLAMIPLKSFGLKT